MGLFTDLRHVVFLYPVFFFCCLGQSLLRGGCSPVCSEACDTPAWHFSGAEDMFRTTADAAHRFAAILADLICSLSAEGLDTTACDPSRRSAHDARSSGHRIPAAAAGS